MKRGTLSKLPNGSRSSPSVCAVLAVAGLHGERRIRGQLGVGQVWEGKILPTLVVAEVHSPCPTMQMTVKESELEKKSLVHLEQVLT